MNSTLISLLRGMEKGYEKDVEYWEAKIKEMNNSDHPDKYIYLRAFNSLLNENKAKLNTVKLIRTKIIPLAEKYKEFEGSLDEDNENES